MTKTAQPQVLVFAGSRFAKPLLVYLANNQSLAGVVLPAPEECEHYAAEVMSLAQELQQAGIRWQYVQRAQLTPDALTHFQADCALSAAFPFIFPTGVIEYFHATGQRGIYNLHASKLPLYRGPQPLYWQLRDQQPTSAMVLHAVTPEIDGGNIIIEREVAIHPLDTLASLHQRQSFEAMQATQQWLEAIAHSTEPLVGEKQIKISPVTGDHRYASRPTIDDCRINFALHSAVQVSAMCRAGNGSAFAAITTLKGLDVQLLQATAIERPTFGVQPGTVLHVGEPEGLLVCAKSSVVRLDIIASPDGIYTGLAFADRFELDAGSSLVTPPKTFSPQPA